MRVDHVLAMPAHEHTLWVWAIIIGSVVVFFGVVVGVVVCIMCVCPTCCLLCCCRGGEEDEDDEEEGEGAGNSWATGELPALRIPAA